MLTRQDNELMCRVEADRPMGKVLRRFWIPGCLLEEIPPAGNGAVRVLLLGERLVAWRNHDGKVGVMAEACPHRGASLMLARDEGDGLRCIYHGWKVDVTGHVREMPGEPKNSRMCGRVHSKSYACTEAGGLLWIYMGAGDPPPLPRFSWMDLPAGHFAVRKAVYNVNFVQSLEGSLDSAHSDFLHSAETSASGDYDQDEVHADGRRSRPSTDTSPDIDVRDTEFGFVYGAIRKAMADPEKLEYVRATAYALPFYSLIPPVYMQASVPLDTFNTAMYLVWYDLDKPLSPVEVGAHETFLGLRMGADLLPDYRRRGTLNNRWLQDRDAMAFGRSYTGLYGTTMQDIAVQESMGPIQDRSDEHLGLTDKAIVRMRKILLGLARQTQEGAEPAIAALRTDYGSIRSAAAVMERGTDWVAQLFGESLRASAGID
ncbi:MAG TPA: Rieske 2Fe-2S domain-containing protein [Steroidobacteraceae bacterium]